MKAALVVAGMAGLVVVGAKEFGERNHAQSSAETQAQADAAAGCWSTDDIRGDRFTLRGAEGTIRNFDATKIEGCRFNVSVEYTGPTGSAGSLHYQAEFVAGESPTFIRYNSPP